MKLLTTDQPEIALFKELSDAMLIHKSLPVIVFLCGGSTVDFYKYFYEKFDSFLQYAKAGGIVNFSNITLALTDDRWFADLENENINYNIIRDTGLFDKFQTLGAKVIKMSASSDMYEDAKNYNKNIHEYMNNNYKILIGGVGPDGHTCGILPQENEENFNSMYGVEEYSAAVKVNNIHPDRITLTPFALRKMNETMLFMKGENKRDVLNKLLYEKHPLWEMPSQIYKEINNVTIFTDIL